jgi:phage protein D
MAKGQFNDMAFDVVLGEGTCSGDPTIHAGTVIELKALGQRFSGLYYITSATHSYRAGRGYITSFSVERSAA